MNDRSDLEPDLAYTHEAVESYLEAVATERAGLFDGIAGAEARGARAVALEQRIVDLERRAGEALVTSSARAWARRRDLAAPAPADQLEGTAGSGVKEMADHD